VYDVARAMFRKSSTESTAYLIVVVKQLDLIGHFGERWV